MTNKEQFDINPEVLGFPLLIVLTMWIVFWIEIRFGFELNQFGIYPQKTSGLIGVLTGPFIHGSLKHLFNNSIPLLVLTTGLFYFYREIRWKVLIYGLLLTGILTWFIGRPALHIGASGVVYMLVAFLFFKGILSKQYHLTAFALIVVFLYGGLWWYLFPIDSKISWEGHLSGFIVGILFALVFKTVPIKNKKYEWERDDFDPSKDPFIQQFDDNGNFVGTPKPEPKEDEEAKDSISLSTPSDKGFRIVYSIRSDKDETKDAAD